MKLLHELLRRTLYIACFCENSCGVIQGMRASVCDFHVSPASQPVNRHLWAAGHLAPAQLPRRKDKNCWPLETQQCMHTPTSSTSPHTRHTNIHKHMRPRDNTHSHKLIYLGSPRRQTLPCLQPRRKLSQEGAKDQRLSFTLSQSLLSIIFFSSSPFLSDISTSTLRSVYLSKATTQQVLLLSKSKSGGGARGQISGWTRQWTHSRECKPGLERKW